MINFRGSAQHDVRVASPALCNHIAYIQLQMGKRIITRARRWSNWRRMEVSRARWVSVLVTRRTQAFIDVSTHEELADVEFREAAPFGLDPCS